MQRLAIKGIIGLVVLAAALSAGFGQAESAHELTPGFKLGRTLEPGERHSYTVRLESGGAVIAEADQEGIDLVIDVYAPDEQLLNTIDSPNGTQGPEPINFTALLTGTYKFVIHTLDKSAEPGKYVMKVAQLLTPEANAKRLAKESLPNQTLYDLWEASVTDPKAVDRFIADRKGKDPILDLTPINASETRITYVILGDEDTERVLLGGGPDFFGIYMHRLGKTNLFFGTQTVPNDARFRYYFNLFKTHRAGPKGEVEVQEMVHLGDYPLEMPNAPPQSDIVAKESVPKGKTVQTTIRSTYLGEERKLTVYTPAGYDGKTPCNLLVVFDGEAYGGLAGQAQARVPTPTILDNLIAEQKIGPTVTILVWNMGHRERDLTGSKPFADFIADEVIPWARSHFPIIAGPRGVVVAGSSYGGFCATYSAFMHPEAIGNVLSQSGSYWITKDPAERSSGAEFYRRAYPSETGMMIEEFKSSRRLPIRFYMEVGIYDLGAAMLGANRELRDVLQVKGYDIDYHEFDGEHSYVNWRGTLSDGLIALLGRKVSQP